MAYHTKIGGEKMGVIAQDHLDFYFADTGRPDKCSEGTLILSLRRHLNGETEKIEVIVDGCMDCLNGYTISGTAVYDNKNYDVGIFVTFMADKADFVRFTEALPLVHIVQEPHSAS